MNDVSSRSHAVFMIDILQQEKTPSNPDPPDPHKIYADEFNAAAVRARSFAHIVLCHDCPLFVNFYFFYRFFKVFYESAELAWDLGAGYLECLVVPPSVVVWCVLVLCGIVLVLQDMCCTTLQLQLNRARRNPTQCGPLRCWMCRPTAAAKPRPTTAASHKKRAHETTTRKHSPGTVLQILHPQTRNAS